MDTTILTDDNFNFYATKHYRNIQCLCTEEFEKDLMTFKHIEKCFRRYKKTGKISERLVFNYLIFLQNIFGIKSTKKMLELKVIEPHWSILKPFLVYLGYIEYTEYANVVMDEEIINKLREFKNNG